MHQEYVQRVVQALEKEQIRVREDNRQEKLGKKIREAQLKKYRIFSSWAIMNATIKV